MSSITKHSLSFGKVQTLFWRILQDQKDKRFVTTERIMCCSDVNIDAFIWALEIYHYFKVFPFDSLIKYFKLALINKNSYNWCNAKNAIFVELTSASCNFLMKKKDIISFEISSWGDHFFISTNYF